jgi:hypothetical protein
MAAVKKNKKIKDELKRLKEIESHMGRLEKERAKLEVQLVREAGGATSALGKKHARRGVANYAYSKFKRRRLVYYLVTSVGAVFVWAGLWGLLETYKVNHWFALAIGVGIIWLTRNYKQ